MYICVYIYVNVFMCIYDVYNAIFDLYILMSMNYNYMYFGHFKFEFIR